MSEIIDSTYEIIGKLGSGGGGVVYLANHLRLDKLVVLKADKRNTNTCSELLRREVTVLKELKHMYIPQVYDYFIEDGISYTVMDYVEGESLDKLQKRENKFSQPQVICWAKQLLDALAYLHSPTHGDPPRGYVHSDIKPANIMLRPNGDICLIDFNISLAMGIENIVGKSDGYSSPEYYGIYPFSVQSADNRKNVQRDDDKTELQNDKTELDAVSESKASERSSSVKKVIVPDARSDIYSVGATLYHLLSGKKPDKNAYNVEPLSRKEFSPPLVDIVTKAMAPDPAERFAGADEMLKAFDDLWTHDPRVIRQKKQLISACVLLSAMLAVSGMTVFTGLRQMERLQSAQVSASNSSEALQRGNVHAAIDYALEALVDDPGIFDVPYTPEAQLALTNALGVYDLYDSFKPYSTIELPSAPFRIMKSPDGSRVAVCYAYELAVYDIETGELIKALQTPESAMCGADFISDEKILYAGIGGLTSYDISSDTVLWQGNPATAIALSGDKTTAAAINGTDGTVNFYDTETGDIVSFRELYGNHLNVPENDKFADPGGSVLKMNEDGSMCAVSLDGGYFGILDIYNLFNDLIIYESSGYTAFDGMFFGDIFAFSAAGGSGSIFGMANCKTGQYLGDMAGNSIFKIRKHNGRLYVSQNDTAVMIDTETFAQTEIAYTENKNISAFDISDNYVISAWDGGYSVFFRGAGILQNNVRERSTDFVLITDSYAVVADRNSPVMEILKLKDTDGSCIIEYDPGISHSEARLLSDRSGVMLFDIEGFTVLNSDGSIRSEVKFTEPEKIYDQQYCHEGDFLEVTYYSGKVVCYSADTGKITSEYEIEPPDDSLDERFETESFIVESPLHGVPYVYDKETGRKTAELKSEDYLTYVTETSGHIIAQYISADGSAYGVLMSANCAPIAEMPYLCDVSEDMLVFDLPDGKIKISPIYELDELKEQAKNYRD